jgi:hypothetical protein
MLSRLDHQEMQFSKAYHVHFAGHHPPGKQVYQGWHEGRKRTSTAVLTDMWTKLLAKEPSSVMTMFFTGLPTKQASNYLNNYKALRILL